MFKVMLVDDEKDIRDGLAQIIDWNSLGFTIEAVASNGREALEILNAKTIHLIITDISMPILNGLEFIKELRTRNLQHNVIILSGYNDFAYLKEALKYRVENYLLKPIDEEELIATLVQVKEDIHRDIYHSLLEKENLSILRSKILNRLVTHNISKLEFMNKSDFLQIDLAAISYRVILIELEGMTELYDRTGERDQLRLFSAMNICEEVLRSRLDGVLFEDSWQHLVFIAKLQTTNPTIPYADIADEVKQALKRFIKEPASVMIGPEVGGIMDIHASYHKSLKLLEYKFYLGREATIHDNQLPTRELLIDVDLDKQIEQLQKAILAGNEPSCLLITHRMYESFKETARISKSFIHHATFELLMSAYKLIKDANGDISKLLHQPEHLYANILSKKTIDEMRNFADENIQMIVHYLGLLKRERPVKVIASVIDYIKHHYSQEITLKQAAEINFMNPGYLGKLFKKETGASFHEYLNKVRIEKAKQLLLTTNHFVYQVSEMVGYKDYNYFHKTFKKYAGTTPSELTN